jgi:hypothetical protein
MTWEALAALAGGAILSLLALWRQHRADERQRQLDQRLVDIEEARHAAEVARTRQAYVTVTGLHAPAHDDADVTSMLYRSGLPL